MDLQQTHLICRMPSKASVSVAVLESRASISRDCVAAYLQLINEIAASDYLSIYR